MTADDGRGDIIEIGGPAREEKGRGRRRLRWLPLVLLAGVGLVWYVRTVPDNPPERPAPSAAPSTTAPPDAPVPTVAAPVVTDAGGPLLGITAGWELYGRGPGVVVRLELARGRVTTTAVPGLLSGGPVSFLVGPDRAVVRPLDAVPGYVVPDGRPAAQTTGDLARSGPMLPGPDPGSVWVTDDDGGRMVQVRFDGRRTGAVLEVPPGGYGFVEPDGAGYPLVGATGGVYSLRPAGIRRITTGDLLAVGPAHWLARECDERLSCAVVLIEQRTGTRSAVQPAVTEPDVGRGLVTADGSRAALWVTRPGQEPRLHLFDLRSGRLESLDMPAGTSFTVQRLAWSPDGRWLFVAGADGRLRAVEASTARTHELDVPLPPIDQVALRAGG